MRIVLSLYHFLLFLLVSWTVYNSFLLMIMVLPEQPTYPLEAVRRTYLNLYLLGATGLENFFTQLNYYFNACITLMNWPILWPVFLFFILTNSISIYMWLRKQTVLSACGVALTAGISGIYTEVALVHFLFWQYSIAGILILYAILALANLFRKRYLPNIALPKWLEWKMPYLIPSVNVIVKRFQKVYKNAER